MPRFAVRLSNFWIWIRGVAWPRAIAAKDVTRLVVDIAAIFSIIIVLVNYASGASIFYNATADYLVRYHADFDPLVKASYEFDYDNKEALQASPDRATYNALVANFVRSKNVEKLIVPAVGTIELIIQCKNKITCRFDNYPALHHDIGQVWLTFGSAIVELRSKGQASSFAADFQKEGRVLAALLPH